MVRQPRGYRHLSWIAQIWQRVLGAWIVLREIKRSAVGTIARTVRIFAPT